MHNQVTRNEKGLLVGCPAFRCIAWLLAVPLTIITRCLSITLLERGPRSAHVLISISDGTCHWTTLSDSITPVESTYAGEWTPVAFA